MNERYLRHIQLEEVGSAGQQKLAHAKVLVVGAGGLGCPILQYLATSGIGTLGIIDHDTVSLSNLHRQILYTANDIGKNKALVAQKKLLELNPEIQVQAFSEALTIDNATDIVSNFDVIVDGTDNFVSRYLISDTCIKLDKPLVFGALYKFEGQVSVFNYQKGPSYRCLFPNPPAIGEVPNCNDIGILGVLPGIVGMLQANEVLKIILGIGEVLSGKLMIINTLNYQQRILQFKRNHEIIESIKKKKLEAVATDDCIFTNRVSLNEIEHIPNARWVDVREVGEKPEILENGIISMPLSQFESINTRRDDDRPTIFFCQSGVRSQKACQLANDKGWTQTYSLIEGANELLNYLNKSNESN